MGWKVTPQRRLPPHGTMCKADTMKHTSISDLMEIRQQQTEGFDFYHAQYESAIFMYVKLWELRGDRKLYYSHSKCCSEKRAVSHPLLTNFSFSLLQVDFTTQSKCIPTPSHRQIAFTCQGVVSLDLKISLLRNGMR